MSEKKYSLKHSETDFYLSSEENRPEPPTYKMYHHPCPPLL